MNDIKIFLKEKRKKATIWSQLIINLLEDEKHVIKIIRNYFYLENLVYYQQILLKCNDLERSFDKEQINAKNQDVFLRKRL